MKTNLEQTGGEFCKLFGDNPRNRIMEFYLEMPHTDFTIGDVAKDLGLNRATTYNTMEEMIEEKFVIQTRKVSGGQLYKLNTEKKEVKMLLKIFDTILNGIVEEYQDK
jgi:DNA-binding IclR family transcriptional regulator